MSKVVFTSQAEQQKVLSNILAAKRRTDPSGLLRAQREGTLAQFLAEDLAAHGLQAEGGPKAAKKVPAAAPTPAAPAPVVPAATKAVAPTPVSAGFSGGPVSPLVERRGSQFSDSPPPSRRPSESTTSNVSPARRGSTSTTGVTKWPVPGTTSPKAPLPNSPIAASSVTSPPASWRRPSVTEQSVSNPTKSLGESNNPLFAGSSPTSWRRPSASENNPATADSPKPGSLSPKLLGSGEERRPSLRPVASATEVKTVDERRPSIRWPEQNQRPSVKLQTDSEDRRALLKHSPSRTGSVSETVPPSPPAVVNTTAEPPSPPASSEAGKTHQKKRSSITDLISKFGGGVHSRENSGSGSKWFGNLTSPRKDSGSAASPSKEETPSLPTSPLATTTSKWHSLSPKKDQPTTPPAGASSPLVSSLAERFGGTHTRENSGGSASKWSTSLSPKKKEVTSPKSPAAPAVPPVAPTSPLVSSLAERFGGVKSPPKQSKPNFLDRRTPPTSPLRKVSNPIRETERPQEPLLASTDEPQPEKRNSVQALIDRFAGKN